MQSLIIVNFSAVSTTEIKQPSCIPSCGKKVHKGDINAILDNNGLQLVQFGIIKRAVHTDVKSAKTPWHHWLHKALYPKYTP